MSQPRGAYILRKLPFAQESRSLCMRAPHQTPQFRDAKRVFFIKSCNGEGGFRVRVRVRKNWSTDCIFAPPSLPVRCKPPTTSKAPSYAVNRHSSPRRISRPRRGASNPVGSAVRVTFVSASQFNVCCIPNDSREQTKEIAMGIKR